MLNLRTVDNLKINFRRFRFLMILIYKVALRKMKREVFLVWFQSKEYKLSQKKVRKLEKDRVEKEKMRKSDILN